MNENKVTILEDIEVINDLVIGYDGEQPKKVKTNQAEGQSSLRKTLMTSVYENEISQIKKHLAKDEHMLIYGTQSVGKTELLTGEIIAEVAEVEVINCVLMG